jgi:hypothetical protein
VKRTAPKTFEGSDAQRFQHIRDRISTGVTFDELKFLIDLIEKLDNIIWQQIQSRADADEKAPREALKRVLRAVGELAAEKETLYTLRVKNSALAGLQENAPVEIPNYGLKFVRSITPRDRETSTLVCSDRPPPCFEFTSPKDVPKKKKRRSKSGAQA